MWLRVFDQHDYIEVSETRGGKTVGVYKPARFRHEAVWEIIRQVNAPDPLELFDKVILLESVHRSEREKTRKEG